MKTHLPNKSKSKSPAVKLKIEPIGSLQYYAFSTLAVTIKAMQKIKVENSPKNLMDYMNTLYIVIVNRLSVPPQSICIWKMGKLQSTSKYNTPLPRKNLWETRTNSIIPFPGTVIFRNCIRCYPYVASWFDLLLCDPHVNVAKKISLVRWILD